MLFILFLFLFLLSILTFYITNTALAKTGDKNGKKNHFFLHFFLTTFATHSHSPIFNRHIFFTSPLKIFRIPHASATHAPRALPRCSHRVPIVFPSCLGCAPIVLLRCKGYTADARLRHSRNKAVGLDGFEAKLTQTSMEIIPLAYPKHTMSTP